MKQVRLTRCVAFSSGHRYWRTDLTETQNRELFGQWASPYNHGHNYRLEVSTVGAVDPPTGMVVNIKDIDDVLQARIVSKFDQKSINDEVPGFADHPPTVENLLGCIRDELEGALPATLTQLKLEETPLLYGELEKRAESWKMTLTRVYEFCASHRLHSPGLSDEENVKLFGKCNNAAGHGHNYLLEVTIAGTPNPETGMMADVCAVDDIVNNLIVDRYDHKNFNSDLPEYQGKPPTSEVIAQTIFASLASALPVKLDRIRLFETARNIFEVRAQDE